MRPQYRVNPAVYGNADKAKVCKICCAEISKSGQGVNWSTMQSEVIYLTRVGDKVNYNIRTRDN